MKPHQVVVGAIALVLAIAAVVSGAEAMSRFGSALSQNTTGAADETFTGPPDGSSAVFVGGDVVEYDFGSVVPFFNIFADGFDFNVYQDESDAAAAFDAIAVAISSDGVAYQAATEVGAFNLDGDGAHDPVFLQSYDVPGDAGAESARFIRITALGEPGIPTGFGLDAMGAIVPPGFEAVAEPACLILLAMGMASMGATQLRRHK